MFCRILFCSSFLVLLCCCRSNGSNRITPESYYQTERSSTEVNVLSTPETETSKNNQNKKHSIRVRDTVHSVDYFRLGYNDGYEDGDHLEKGRQFRKDIPSVLQQEYRRGYFAGYADGRAQADVGDDYYLGINRADYFDLSEDSYVGDDDEWDDDDDW